MKQGARYLRFSDDKQSSHSIERQDMVTEQWMKQNDVRIADTFVDKGKSAKTFDRPDMKMLMDFIRKNHRTVDYLVVSELTRFSRNLGDAVNLVKEIQSTYNIRIVSAGRGAIYDVTESNSFFMMALEFLLGNSENIKRESDINGGIYTAKAKEGRYVHGQPPYGYIRVGKGEDSHLEIDPDKAIIVQYIFEAYLKNMPFNMIAEEVKAMGFPHGSASMIQKVLAKPLYTGRQYVKPWRDLPGGLFDAMHKPIIDVLTWERVQEKMKGKARKGISISDEMPLRNVLRCHCTQLLTGAPSRGRLGDYYYYYKCKFPKHNNISAIKAHQQLDEALCYMSLSDRMVTAIKEKSEQAFQERSRDNKKILVRKKLELEQVSTQLQSIEAKWINNQIAYETYQKWFADLTQQRMLIKAQTDDLKRDDNELYMLMKHNIDRFTDLQFLYNNFETVDKQEFLRLVFDRKLYYQGGIYRTTYIIPQFTHNALILKEKQLLVLDEKRVVSSKLPSGGAAGSRTLVQTYSP